jgi:DNA-binding transcriptional regulator/RsmH inhibitor MraZ
MLLAMFEVGGMVSCPPTEMWLRTHGRGGIDYDDFFDYYKNQEQAFAFEIGTLRKFVDGTTVASIMGADYVPHSFDLLSPDQACETGKYLTGKPLDDYKNDPQEYRMQDDAMCEFFIDDASRLRRIVQLMPDGDPTAGFLNMLWAYAVKHDRLVDLANVLLGFDSKHKTIDGNENCDWFWRCCKPMELEESYDFFSHLMDFAKVRAHLERGTYDDWHDNSLAKFDCMESYKDSDVGKGIIGIDDVLDQLLAKYESEVEFERQRDREEGRFAKPPDFLQVDDGIGVQNGPFTGIFVGRFVLDIADDDLLNLPLEFQTELNGNEMFIMKNPARANALVLLPVDIYDKCIKSIKDGADVSEVTKSLYEQAERVRIDKRGRIRIPQKLLSCIRAGKSGKVVLRGHISTIDIFRDV